MEADGQQELLQAFATSQEAEFVLAAEIQDQVASGIGVLQHLVEELKAKQHDSERIASERQQKWNALQELYSSGKLVPAGAAARIEELENALSSQATALQQAQSQAKQAEELLGEGATPEIKQQIAEMEGNLEKRRETINIARERILLLQEKIETFAAERAASQQHLIDTEARLERQSAALHSAEERLSELRSKLEAKGEGDDAVAAEIKVLESQIEEKEQALGAAEKRNTELQEEAEKHLSEVARVEDRIRALEGMLVDRSTEAAEVHEQASALEKELAQQQTRVAELEKQLADAKVEKEAADAEVVRINNLPDEQSPVIEALKIEKSELEKRATEMENALRLAEQKRDDAQKEAKEWRQQAEEQTSSIADSAGKIMGLESALMTEHAKVVEAQQSAASLEDEIKKAAATLDETQQRITGLELALSERDAAIESAKKRADEAENKLGQMVAQSGDAEQRISALQTDIEHTKQKHAELTEVCKKYEEDAKAARQAQDQAARSASDARTALQVLTSEMEAAEGRFVACKERAEEAEKQAQLIQSAHDQLAEEVKKDATEKENAVAAAKEAETAMTAVRDELEALRRQHSVAVSQNKSHAQQTEALRARVAELEAALQNAPEPETLAALKAQVDEERYRATTLEERLNSEIAKGTKAGLAKQLSDALHDAEEVREELRKLKHSIGTGTNNAMVKESVPAPARVQAIDLKRVIKSMPPEKRRNLAEILISAGVLTQEQVQRAQAEQKNQADTTLPGVLLNSGLVDEGTLAEAVALQSGLPLVAVNEDAVDIEVVQELPERIARMYCCILLRSSSSQLDVAMANPGNLLAIEDIERVTSKQVNPVVALRSEIEAAIEKYYWEPE